MAQEIAFSLQSGAFDSKVRPQQLDWPLFVETLFAVLPIKADKNKVTAFVPASFIPYDDVPIVEDPKTKTLKKDGHRKDKYVLNVTCMVLDIDENLKHGDMLALLAAVKALKCAYVMHFTHSCYKAYTQRGEYKVRVVIPLSEPIANKQWLNFWERARGMFAQWKWDVKTKNTSRLYFRPAAPSREAFDWMIANDWLEYDVTSPPLDINVVLNAPKPLAARAQTTATAWSNTPLPQLMADMRRWQRDLRQRNSGLAMALEAVLDGNVYAEDGDRNDAMTRITNAMAYKYVHEDPHKLARVFERSHELMAVEHASPPDDLEKVADAVARAQQECLQKRAVALEKKSSRESRTMKRVANNQEAGHEYTPAERSIIQNRLGVDSSEMDDCWILATQNGKELYISTLNGIENYQYSPDTFATVIQDLLPTGIPLEKTVGSKQDIRSVPLTLREILPKHGTVLKDVIHDYTSPNYALKDRYLSIPCHRSKLQPVFHNSADVFLHALFDAEYGTAERWLSFFADTSDKIAALVLYGEKNTGKTLLASGLSQLWEYGQFIPFETAIGRFNFDLTKMPLIFADERLPNDDHVTKHLREIVTTKLFTVEKKYGAMTKCIGYRRLIIASNSLQKLGDDRQELSITDLDALRERMWEVKASMNALEYLNSLSVHERNDLADFQIAEHTLWIEANRKAERETGRLAVSGSSNVGRYIILADRQVQQILQALMTVMDKARSGKSDRVCMLGYRWGQGQVHIANTGVTTNETFCALFKNRLNWSSPGKHLRKVATHNRTKATMDGIKTNCFNIDTELFFAYLDEHQGVDVDVYRAMIDGEIQGA